MYTKGENPKAYKGDIIEVRSAFTWDDDIPIPSWRGEVLSARGLVLEVLPLDAKSKFDIKTVYKNPNIHRYHIVERGKKSKR